MTDDKIIAAAGEPVAIVTELNPRAWDRFVIGRVNPGTQLYPAAAILSAVKPLRERINSLSMALADTEALELGTSEANIKLRERIAELEAEVARKISAGEYVIKQLNAALAREQVLRDALVLAKIQGSKKDRDFIIDSAIALPHDDTALRQIVEDERDAERYRFLRDTRDSTDELITAFRLLESWETPADELDEAIDAAIRASSNQ